jgi:hypothetical protein
MVYMLVGIMAVVCVILVGVLTMLSVDRKTFRFVPLIVLVIVLMLWAITVIGVM